MKQVKSDDEFNTKSVMKISGDFCALGIVSLLLGLTYGLVLSYILKYVRSCTKSPVVECAMIFSFAYLSYVTAEIYH